MTFVHLSRESARVANRITVSVLLSTLAFWAYTQTLLPGVDLGDTGGFQAAVLWPEVSARQAYPLYYGLARPFVALASPANPARALNLFSALSAAFAVGVLTFVCATVTSSIAAGAVGGTLLAFSYTFWTQAVIAEVYSLELMLIGLCLAGLYAYAVQPTMTRLLIFFGMYALSFGNHIGMILLLVPFALFLIQTTPARRELFRLRVAAAAALIAFAGALQYAPNFMAEGGSLIPPESWTERFAAFWFDTTKQDWRESMVLGIGTDQIGDRVAMWWFDARQQFGAAGLAMAAAGAIYLWRTSRPWAVLVLTAYALTTGFALTYNVGDAHVFFLPGHFMTAFCAGAGVAGIVHLWGGPYQVRRASRERGPRRAILRGAVPWLAPQATILVAALAYGGWRGWTTWPVADRHADRRGEQLIARLTGSVSERDALLVSQMNWQLENVLLYTGRYVRRDLAWVRLGDVMSHWPFLVQDNHRLGRDVVITADAAAEVVGAYGPAFPIVEDPAMPVVALPEAVAQVPPGMPYVLSVLTPPRERALDPDALADALATLTGGNAAARRPAAYELVAGIAGEAPQIYRSSDRPFTERFRILNEPFIVRMDSWLPFDTFRRAGFGHVVRGRDHILILERGLNLVWLGRDGTPSQPYYAASLFALEPRFRIPAATLELAYGRPQGQGPGPRGPQGVGVNLERHLRSEHGSPTPHRHLALPGSGAPGRSGRACAQRGGTGAPAAIPGYPRLLRRLCALLPRGGTSYPDNRARHRRDQEAGVDAVGVHDSREEGVCVGRPQGLLVHSGGSAGHGYHSAAG